MQNRSNPFAQYGIKSIHIPMFYNQSSLPNVASIFNKEITKSLTSFKDLSLSKGFEKSDAVLVGIVTSQDMRKDVIRTKSSKRIENTFGEEALGDKREDFHIPSTSSVNLGLRIIVIKHPTKSEIQFLQSSLGEQAKNSKIIFNENIGVSENFYLKELDAGSLQVLGTQNRGVQKETYKALGVKAARSFKDMILYAF